MSALKKGVKICSKLGTSIPFRDSHLSLTIRIPTTGSSKILRK